MKWVGSSAERPQALESEASAKYGVFSPSLGVFICERREYLHPSQTVKVKGDMMDVKG